MTDGLGAGPLIVDAYRWFARSTQQPPIWGGLMEIDAGFTATIVENDGTAVVVI